MPLIIKSTNQETCHHAEKQLQIVLNQTPESIKKLIKSYIENQYQLLTNFFYIEMLEDDQTVKFLDHGIVNKRLKLSLGNWLKQLFSLESESDLKALIARQLEIGEVHARIQVPIHLVAQGSRLLKRTILKNALRIEGEFNDYLAAIYVNDLVDISIELMSLAFIQNNDRTTRTDEAYRINALGHNVAIEKERQRAALSDWGQHIAFNIYKGLSLENGLLRYSEFGLWLTHKALSIFNNEQYVEEVVKAVNKIDTVLLPQILVGNLDQQKLSPLLSSLQNEIGHIKYILTELFDSMLELENGRDALTRLLNRRFLAPVLTREINIARKSQRNFCVLLLDIDFFKKVNDTYGHDAGDVVLQQTAAILTNMLRSGDFIFRYGGEEIIILLVEVDFFLAQETAERIRKNIEQTNILLANQTTIHITVSIGAAMFDGHPDYEYLIKRADDVLYQAKNSGRNRCIFN